MLGIDGGGTETIAAVADTDGRVLGLAKAGCGCFEDVGDASAQMETRKAILEALKNAGVRDEKLIGACYGMAGADREKDYARIRAFLDPINPARCMSIRNDIDLILKAGIPDEIGIAVGCGTGTNCIGRNRNGRRIQVGGLGYELGDRAGGTYLGLVALHQAMRGQDGRGAPTMLHDAICRTLEVESLVDIVDRFYLGARRKLDFSTLAPVVFECASAGDEVAADLLSQMANEVASMIRVARSHLFDRDETVKAVLGGGLIKAHQFDLAGRVEDVLTDETMRFTVISLNTEPVVGAIFYALSECELRITEDVVRTTMTSLALALKREEVKSGG